MNRFGEAIEPPPLGNFHHGAAAACSAVSMLALPVATGFDWGLLGLFFGALFAMGSFMAFCFTAYYLALTVTNARRGAGLLAMGWGATGLVLAVSAYLGWNGTSGC